MTLDVGRGGTLLYMFRSKCAGERDYRSDSSPYVLLYEAIGGSILARESRRGRPPPFERPPGGTESRTLTSPDDARRRLRLSREGSCQPVPQCRNAGRDIAFVSRGRLGAATATRTRLERRVVHDRSAGGEHGARAPAHDAPWAPVGGGGVCFPDAPVLIVLRFELQQGG